MTQRGYSQAEVINRSSAGELLYAAFTETCCLWITELLYTIKHFLSSAFLKICKNIFRSNLSAPSSSSYSRPAQPIVLLNTDRKWKHSLFCDGGMQPPKCVSPFLSMYATFIVKFFFEVRKIEIKTSSFEVKLSVFYRRRQ